MMMCLEGRYSRQMETSVSLVIDVNLGLNNGEPSTITTSGIIYIS